MDILLALRHNDARFAKRHYGLLGVPTDADMICAMAHHANACLEKMTRRYVRSHKTFGLACEVLRQAAYLGRVDVLHEWIEHRGATPTHLAVLLDAGARGREETTLEYLLTVLSKQTSTFLWKAPDPCPLTEPVLCPLEDGPFVAASLAPYPKLFERLMDICARDEATRTMVRGQLLQTTRKKYSGLEFDAIFDHDASAVLLEKRFCTRLLSLALTQSYPTPFSRLLQNDTFARALRDDPTFVFNTLFLDFSARHVQNGQPSEHATGVLHSLMKTVPTEFEQHWLEKTNVANEEVSAFAFSLFDFFATHHPQVIERLQPGTFHRPEHAPVFEALEQKQVLNRNVSGRGATSRRRI